MRVVDKSVLDAPATLLTADAKVTGQLTGPASAVAYVINHNTDNTLATLRFRLKDVKMSAAEDSFKIGDQQFNTGSFILKKEGNPQDLRSRLGAAVTELGLKAVGVDKLPEVKTHELAVPRIAIVHTWTNTQNEGWFRIEFDRLQIPYTYISDHVIRNTPNLREKYDVLIFPPVGGSAQTIVNGMPQRGEADSVEGVGRNAELRQVAGSNRRHARRDDSYRRGEPSAVHRRRRFVYHDRQQRFFRYRSTTASRPASRFNLPTNSRRADRSTTPRSRIARVRLLMVTMPVCRSTSVRRRCSR